MSSHSTTADEIVPSTLVQASSGNGTRERKPKLSKKAELSAYFTIAAAAFGLISDGYQNNLMTMSNVVFKKLYPHDYTTSVSTRVSNSLLVGDIFGMLLVGLICDRFGRKVALVGTTFIIRLNRHSELALLRPCTPTRRLTHIEGVGGEYPASSTGASEAANEKMITQRGPILVMVTDFMLVFGGPVAVSVFLIVLSAAGEDHLGTVWRVCFGIGIIFPLSVFYFRMRMLSSELYRKGAIKHRVPCGLAIKRYWKPLIGTCGSWFIFDFVFYPNQIFSGIIISSVIKDGDIKATAEWQLLLGALALPGVFIGALICNHIGRRNTMMIGFGGYVVFGLIIGCAYDKVTKIIPLFILFYGLLQTFGNLGPGDMSILVSAESYATPIRGTCFGVSAALGKVGAAVGTQVFTPIQNNLGQNWTFIIAAIFGLAGILVTFFFVPDMTGVDFVDEDRKFMEYLAENGWRGQVGEDVDEVSVEDIEISSENEKK
ncbi:MFS Git1p-like glycerophosphoinositol permease [Panus rudis PR-1116 ss-1]|nr:MFS Git1p-like glycerophosphoinositol permease [Panus rudis PR-1116 ss-1]